MSQFKFDSIQRQKLGQPALNSLKKLEKSNNMSELGRARYELILLSLKVPILT